MKPFNFFGHRLACLAVWVLVTLLAGSRLLALDPLVPDRMLATIPIDEPIIKESLQYQQSLVACARDDRRVCLVLSSPPLRAYSTLEIVTIDRHLPSHRLRGDLRVNLGDILHALFTSDAVYLEAALVGDALFLVTASDGNAYHHLIRFDLLTGSMEATPLRNPSEEIWGPVTGFAAVNRHLVLVYESASDLRYVTFPSAGPLGSFNPATLLSLEGTQSQPALAFDGSRLLVVFRDERRNEGDIYAALFDAALQPLLARPEVVAVAPAAQKYPSATVTSTGFLVTWSDARNGGSFESHIRGIRLDQSARAVGSELVFGFPTAVGQRRECRFERLGSNTFVGCPDQPGSYRTPLRSVRVPAEGALTEPVRSGLSDGDRAWLVALDAEVFAIGSREQGLRQPIVADPSPSVAPPDLLPSLIPQLEPNSQTDPVVLCHAGKWLVAWLDTRADSADPEVWGCFLASKTALPTQPIRIGKVTQRISGSGSYAPRTYLAGAVLRDGFLLAWPRVLTFVDLNGAVRDLGVVTADAPLVVSALPHGVMVGAARGESWLRWIRSSTPPQTFNRAVQVDDPFEFVELGGVPHIVRLGRSEFGSRRIQLKTAIFPSSPNDTLNSGWIPLVGDDPGTFHAFNLGETAWLGWIGYGPNGKGRVLRFNRIATNGVLANLDDRVFESPGHNVVEFRCFASTNRVAVVWATSPVDAFGSVTNGSPVYSHFTILGADGEPVANWSNLAGFPLFPAGVSGQSDETGWLFAHTVALGSWRVTLSPFADDGLSLAEPGGELSMQLRDGGPRLVWPRRVGLGPVRVGSGAGTWQPLFLYPGQVPEIRGDTLDYRPQFGAHPAEFFRLLR